MSKNDGYVATQSITTVAIAEQVTLMSGTEDLVRLTAKRSVFSAEDLEAGRATRDDPVKVIDFLLVGHVDPPIMLAKLMHQGVLVGIRSR